MKKVLLLCLFFTLNLAWSQVPVEIMKSQLGSSFNAIQQYERKILSINNKDKSQLTEYSKNEFKKESITFRDELDPAYKLLATQPRIKEYFTFTTSGDTITASILPEYYNKSPLKIQKWVIKKGKVTYYYSKVEKSSWVYDDKFEYHIVFTPEGKYAGHILSLRIGMNYINNGIVKVIVCTPTY